MTWEGRNECPRQIERTEPISDDEEDDYYIDDDQDD